MTTRQGYNITRFKLSDYDMDCFEGPVAGEQLLDFTLYDVEGNPVTPKDLLGRWTVLEMGSQTCPMYARNMKRMQKIREKYADVQFNIVYVHEAHPGERRSAHDSLADKLAAAKQLQTHYGEGRRVLVDSVDGDMHQRYGLMPNSVYVVDPEGIVTYRSNWTVIDRLEEALDNRDDRHLRKEYVTLKHLDFPPPHIMAKVLFRGGFKALWDFVKAAPTLSGAHRSSDQFAEKNGGLKRGC